MFDFLGDILAYEDRHLTALFVGLDHRYPHQQVAGVLFLFPTHQLFVGGAILQYFPDD